MREDGSNSFNLLTMAYKGIIIEESLEDKSVLNGVRIINTEVIQVTDSHQAPWIDQWTMHTIEIQDDKVDIFAQELSHTIENRKCWYADFQNDERHYVIFRDKIFIVDKNHSEQYQEIVRFGLEQGIPRHQLDFVHQP